MSDDDVRAAVRSDAALVLIEAPAGCGKTHQGADYAREVATSSGRSSPLILTHTHAACSVFAARTRGAHHRVSIRTIDSLIAQIATAYHLGLGLPQDIPSWARKRESGYDELASIVSALLARHTMIAAAIARRHSVVICDEHQDSSTHQHSIVNAIHQQGASLRLFIDPMQRIFGERTKGIRGCDWIELRAQPHRFAALDTPHRWTDGCTALGEWTLEARRALGNGDLLDLRPGHRPESVEVVIAENQAQRNLAYQLSRSDREQIDMFERRYDSLLVLTRHNATAASLRSFFNRRISLWEGYTRYALDRLVDAIKETNGDCNVLGTAIITFMNQIGIGFTASSFGNFLQQELRDGCSARRRGKPAKIQELARLLLADPDHRGVAAVLRRLAEFKRNDDGDFAAVRVDCNKEFWDAISLGEFSTVEDGLAEITHRRNYARPEPPARAISIVHKAKGLECDATILMPCDRTTFPDNLTARCLLYVAISRAKHRLMIVASREHPSPLLRI